MQNWRWWWLVHCCNITATISLNTLAIIMWLSTENCKRGKDPPLPLSHCSVVMHQLPHWYPPSPLMYVSHLALVNASLTSEPLGAVGMCWWLVKLEGGESEALPVLQEGVVKQCQHLLLQTRPTATEEADNPPGSIYHTHTTTSPSLSQHVVSTTGEH